MRYLSVCSGIEAASQAWHPLGWEPAAFSEIEAFPSAVLSHHYPSVPNLGDMTRYKEWNLNGSIDLLVGGTPRQSFSVAGLRKGMDDPRGNLAIVFLGLADHFRPRWVVWENVPGVLSSSGGRDFGSFLGGLGQLGYGWAYRVLDAQYVRVQSHPRAVPQRRRRVFVVGYLGDWRRAAAVLLERESLSGNPAPSRTTGERVATSVTQCPPFSRTGNERVEAEAMVVAFDPDQSSNPKATHQASVEHSPPLIKSRPPAVAGVSPTLRGRANSSHRADSQAYVPDTWPQQVSPTLNAQYGEKMGLEDQNALHGGGLFVAADMQRSASGVRRLTPTECERLQGFPDGYTLVPYRGKPASDGPRYKALGNSMAVNVMRWIGERIAEADAITNA